MSSFSSWRRSGPPTSSTSPSGSSDSPKVLISSSAAPTRLTPPPHGDGAPCLQCLTLLLPHLFSFCFHLLFNLLCVSVFVFYLSKDLLALWLPGEYFWIQLLEKILLEFFRLLKKILTTLFFFYLVMHNIYNQNMSKTHESSCLVKKRRTRRRTRCQTFVSAHQPGVQRPPKLCKHDSKPPLHGQGQLSTVTFTP